MNNLAWKIVSNFKFLFSSLKECSIVSLSLSRTCSEPININLIKRLKNTRRDPEQTPGPRLNAPGVYLKIGSFDPALKRSLRVIEKIRYMETAFLRSSAIVCDLRSAIYDRLRSYGNQPLRLFLICWFTCNVMASWKLPAILIQTL